MRVRKGSGSALERVGAAGSGSQWGFPLFSPLLHASGGGGGIAQCTVTHPGAILRDYGPSYALSTPTSPCDLKKVKESQRGGGTTAPGPLPCPHTNRSPRRASKFFEKGTLALHGVIS